MKRKGKLTIWKKLLLILAGILIIAAVGCGIYISDYYHADDKALEAVKNPMPGISVSQTNHRLIFTPENPSAGLIFYPGGKVQYEAYAPLMQACASKGILCVLVQMPGNLAVLDINAADGIQEEYPEIEKWYLAGHSLGGSMAAAYLNTHAAEYDGLILLASYSTYDLSQSGLSVMSIYGLEDKVLSMEAYKKYAENLPDDFTEVIIPGGCHAYFGCYGAQDGDGTPTISNEEQIQQTANAIAETMTA